MIKEWYEWHITGDAGPNFPPYEVTLTDEDVVNRLLRDDGGFRRSVTNIKVQKRKVVMETTEWETVE
jgi:hypothetical protein